MSERELTPERVKEICYQIACEKRDSGKWAKLSSVKSYLTKWSFIKYDWERDIYLNCPVTERADKAQAEADRTKAEEEAYRAQREAQRIEEERLKAEQFRVSELERLKNYRKKTLGTLNSAKSSNLEGVEVMIKSLNDRLENIELEISELEKCDEKLSA